MAPGDDQPTSYVFTSGVELLRVDDVDGTLVKAETHGGKVLSPAFDADGIGRMAIVSDPTGLVFGVITPA